MTEKSPVIGDLVEEYREVVRPARGRVRAAIWFAGQLASLVRPWMWGAALGALLGIENLVGTAIGPVSDDDPVLLLGMLAVALTLWASLAYQASRRNGRWADGVAAGASAATLTMVVSQVANCIRVVAFAGTLQYDPEWASLMARYHASGLTDLRVFVFREYAWGTPIFIAVFVALGTIVAAGAAAIGATRPQSPLRARA